MGGYRAALVVTDVVVPAGNEQMTDFKINANHPVIIVPAFQAAKSSSHRFSLNSRSLI
jgi:hypothetical protein